MGLPRFLLPVSPATTALTVPPGAVAAGDAAAGGATPGAPPAWGRTLGEAHRPPRRLRPVEVLALGAILMAAASLRLHQIGGPSFWTDEFLSMKASGGWGPAEPYYRFHEPIVAAPVATRLRDARPIPAVHAAVAQVSHPPLYFFLLRAWREAFGDSEAAVRSLSVLASLAAIVLVFGAARTMNGPAVAFGSALLMAVAVPQIRYAQETRGYALVLALTAGLFAAIAMIERHGPSRLRMGVVLGCTAAALLTHFHAAGPVAGAFVYAGLRFRGRTRRRALTVMVLGGAVWALVWVPTAVQQVSVGLRHTAEWQRRALTLGMEPELLALARLPARLLTEWDWKNAGDSPWAWPVLLGVAGGMWHRRMGLWAALFAGNVATVLLVDLIVSVEQLRIARYCLLGSPGVYVALANLGALVGRRAGALATCSACGVALGALPTAYRPNEPPWREYANVIADLASGPAALVLLTPARTDRPVLLALLHYAPPGSIVPVLVNEAPQAGSYQFLAGPALLLTDTADARRRARGPLTREDGVLVRRVVRVLEWPGMPDAWRVEPRPAPVTGYTPSPSAPP